MFDAAAASPDPGVLETAVEIEVAGSGLVADPAGALYLAADSLLIVSDLHLEKGSRWAARGMLLPPWDTAATLARLARLLERLRPKRVLALGDSFDDSAGGDRLTTPDREALTELMKGRDWLWISGNHDPRPPSDLGGDAAQALTIGALTFRHAPEPKPAAGEIAGHLHPVARVVTPRGSVRRRCFAGDGSRCVMPAFGAYAGGLNIRNSAYAALFAASEFRAHVLGRERVYAVSLRSCAVD